MKEGIKIRTQSEIITKTTGLMYPFILLFGFYIILNGANSPGGGFQGGAILAAVFISRYFAMPIFDLKIDILRKLEKIVFVLIILVPTLFIFLGLNKNYSYLNKYYLVLINILIGIKVSFGLTIVFFRFMFFESR